MECKQQEDFARAIKLYDLRMPDILYLLTSAGKINGILLKLENSTVCRWAFILFV